MANRAIGLAEAIAALREDLLAAIDAGEGSRMRFRLAPVELSLRVSVTKQGNGKVGWHVLELGGSYEAATVQTLTLRLDPVWRQENGSYGSDFVVADEVLSEPAVGPHD
jgi:Trypsin-co-occurring domain 2